MKNCVVLLLVAFLTLAPTLNFSFNNKYKLKTVVIDPGHGGKDPGALGYSVSREKDIVLAVGLKLGQYIKENFPDVKVVYTREKDVFVELHERARIANEAKADLFISIHCNASSSPSAYGTEIYVLGLHKTEDNLETAKRENSVIIMEDDYVQQYDGFDPKSPEGHIMFSMLTDAHLDQSITFASICNDQFENRVYRKSRGVMQAGFMVLYRSAVPSVLVELGFLTNKNEEAYLLSKQGTDYMASALYRAFKDYKERVEVEVTEDKVPEEPAPQPELPKVVFRVQFLASSNKLQPGDARFKGVKDYSVEEETKYKVYRYLTGEFTDLSQAVAHQNALRQKGLKDAFVVAYKNGKRVSVEEAIAAGKN